MKYLYSLLLLCFGLGLSLQAQPFQIGSTTITFNDPSRSNRAVQTDIYYPANRAGANVPVTSGLQFPVVVFGHGFSMTVSAYQNIWSALVPQGYIVALPRTEGGLLPSHTNFGRDLAFVIGQIQQAGAQSTGLFAGRVASTSCVMGHSMGGGASFLALQYNSNITAIATLAPAETNPSASSAARSATKPALIFAGGNDCVTPASQHSLLIYNASAASCKTYINILGGSHCQFANSNFNCSFGEATCSPRASVSRSTQQNKVMEYLLPWLNFRLKNACQNWFNLQARLTGDATVSFQQTCAAPITCSVPGNPLAGNITATSARLSWASSDCVADYEVRYRRVSTNTWTTLNAGLNIFLVVSGLQSSTTYEWEVRRRCDANGSLNSSWGAGNQFTTSGLRLGMETPWSEVDAPDFKIVPNPNKGLFQLELASLSGEAPVMSVYDNLGKLVAQRQIEPVQSAFERTPVQVQPLPAGIYIIQLTFSSGYLTKRLLIE